MKKMYIHYFLIAFFTAITLSCLSQGLIVKTETFPVDWGDDSSERISSQIVSIMNQNIRRYRYYIYTYSINENSENSAWDNELKIVTYTNMEKVSMVFNYFAIHLYYTDEYDMRINGISSQYATMRGSANDFNSTLDRISLSLDKHKFGDPIKRVTDIIWLYSLRLHTVSTDD